MIMNIYQLYSLQQLFNVTNLISVFYITFDKKHKVKGEVHNFWELVYVEEGTIGVTAHDQIFELHKGQMIFHKPGEFHNLWSANGSNPTVFILTFTLDTEVKELENILCTLTDSEIHTTQTLISECSVFETLVDDETTLMSMNCAAPLTYGLNHTVKNYLEILLLSIIKNHQSESYPTTLNASQANYHKITSYIQGNLFNKLSINMICENCNISPTALKNLFRKYAGISVMEYVSNLKIQASIPLLEAGMSHQEIADQLAFSSPYYFSTVFKRIIGASPKHFKASHNH